MIYSDILTKTEQVRDRLVSAINSKGGSLVSNASLNQCADAVTNLPEGGGGEVARTLPGQIFHASFASDSEYAESGQPLKKINTPQFVVEDGIQCVNIYDAGFQIDYPLFYGKNPFTISFWGKDSSANSEDENFDVIFQGDAGGYGRMNVTFLAGKFSVSNMSDWTSAPTVTSDSFHHYVVTYDQKYHLFEDNLPVAESSYEFNLNLPRNPTLIGYNSEYTEKRNFYLANMKVFTRVLSSEEIAQLYSEFKSATGSGGDDGGSGESGGGSSIYTGDLVAKVYGTPRGDITATLTCVNPDAIRQNDVVWEGKATAIIDYSFSVNTYSGKWSLNVDTDTMGDVVYGGDNFTTDNSVPWDATWTNTGGTSRTCEVSKA